MADGNRWKDHYTDRAREENWLARSVYKLEEIDKRHKIIRQGLRILDLGCYPGSWTQYCLKKTGREGFVTGIDLRRPDRIQAVNFRFIEADILAIDPRGLYRETGGMDAVISDLAPQTTGIHVADVSRSMALAEKALEIACNVLNRDGNFICKVFEGGDFKSLKDKASGFFSETRTLRPSAVRKRSREVYLIGLGFVRKSID
ncbi:MAG: RlmE family RNA methyltransferase [Deltaproteobacteria bacterium]|nr:RlmE family RNA methyltransferase [Deltaproteobacteria bacterium]